MVAVLRALAEAGGPAVDVLDPHRLELVLARVEPLAVLPRVYDLVQQ
jgi:hypothetical protein